ncbi:S-layer protein [Candidatus Marsarchaeota archaeon]|nr:S-layer protein [Candidatus Marsarchaeota archaeon]
MKSLNPKRIAAVVGGAALLATGLAFAGPISFQNVPIISNSGQPLVQIVVGTLAKPSDGVAAANIAAAIGNLAYTSVPVTASVNTTQAAKGRSGCWLSSAKYSLTNQQVYFNESTTAYISGTYSFSALIGSVFNRGVKTNQYGATKTLQSSSQYTYPEEDVISPSGVSMPSPFTTYGSVPFEYSVTASTSGGGVSFSSFSVGTNDNILRVTSSQLPALASNMGANLESEYLWLTGMPVFDQGSNNNINQFNLTNVGGAYQAVFGNPIEFRSSSNGVNNAQLQLFGQNWTIINYMLPGTSAYNSTSGVKTTTSLDTVSGGGLSLASSLEPEKTVYVGQNYSTGGAENFTVQVADIGQPNSNGISPAALKVYLNGALYNVSAVNPGTTAKFNDSGHNLYVKVYQTFAGLYAYEKYAKIQLYSNVVNVTSGNEFNSTYDKGWNIDLLWTNTSSTTSAGNAIALQSIVVFNTTPTYLTPGQSFGFIGNPKAYKLTFEQPSFGSGTYTPVTLSTSESNVKYINPGSFGENITEPVQMLTVSAPSSLSNAFTVGGVPSSSVTYDLIPLSFSSTASTSNALTVTGALSAATDFENQISSTHPLTIKFQGLTTSNTLVTATNTLTSYSEPFTPTFPQSITEITNITVSYVLPEMTVSGTFGTGGSAALSYSATPDEMYLRSGQSNYNLITISGNQVQFNQNNGQRPNFDMNAEANFNPVGHSYELFNYSMSEYPVPANQTSTDSFTVGLVNSSSANPTSPFILNYSAPISGSIAHDNVTYTTNTQGSTVSLNAAQGFYSEKGSEVASISPGSVTINFARGVDMLNFVVSPYNITAVSKNYKTVGPVGIGQPVPNVPNVTVESVTANISVSNASGATVTGISNLTAIPSVSSATTPVLLKNLTTSPLAVLNSTANPSSNLILIGSGFVNGLSAQLQASNNITFTPTSAPVLQAFGSNRILIAGYSANQTTAEANKFIQDLYASASTS